MAKLKILDEIEKLWAAIGQMSLAWDNIIGKPEKFPPITSSSGDVIAEGIALDATQNNKDVEGTLANQIKNIEDRGYLESVEAVGVTETMLNEYKNNGKYTLKLTGVTGVPDGWYMVDVMSHKDKEYCTQTLTTMWIETDWWMGGDMYIRSLRNADKTWLLKEYVSANVEFRDFDFTSDWDAMGYGRTCNYEVQNNKVVVNVAFKRLSGRIEANTSYTVANNMPRSKGEQQISSIIYAEQAGGSVMGVGRVDITSDGVLDVMMSVGCDFVGGIFSYYCK